MKYSQQPMALFIAGLLIALISQSVIAAESTVVQIDEDDIGGVVTSTNGPEAGVWVIAETYDLPTGYSKTVITDEQGRYVIPDLPDGNYEVFVRGYGLVESPRVDAIPGQQLALTAVVAPSEAAAAEYYPASYWNSLLELPDPEEFPLFGGAETQGEFKAAMQNCLMCHQMGSKITRELNPEMGSFNSTEEAWNHRIRQGQLGNTMVRMMNSMGYDRGLEVYADWIDRIAEGDLPPAPPRPQGVERNVVITQWDIARDISFLHDMYGTDPRDPSVNANGKMIATDFSLGVMWILDPITHSVEEVELPYAQGVELTDINTFSPPSMEFPSLYWGDEIIYREYGGSEIQGLLPDGRAVINHSFRPAGNPDRCTSGNTFADFFPLQGAGRQQVLYDINTGEFELIDTCYNTHHAAFAEDEDDTIYQAALGLRNAIGWFKPRIWDETGDITAASGWCPAYYDTNQNGTYDEDEDQLADMNGYFISWNPLDGSVWYAFTGTNPGAMVRIHPGENPPYSCTTEIYEPPFYNDEAPGQIAALPRGSATDRNGVVWTALAGSGHLGKFDRRLCEIQEGPGKLDPQHCSEGWTLYPLPTPDMDNAEAITGSADYMYSSWVDQFNILGFGANVPYLTGTNSDSLMGFDPVEEEWFVMRVPYPMGFYTRSMGGRVDNPYIGWKGRGIWAANEIRNPWHIEGGKGQTPTAAQFQFRPHPLAH